MPVVIARVTQDILNADDLVAAVESSSAGAVTVFLGRIRDHDPEALGEVTGIEYTHHPDADRMIGEIVGRVCERLDPSGEARVAAVHRVGRLDVGDLALVAAVATSHRQLGFALVQEVVEAIKAELPIWKQQFEVDGRNVWSNLGLESE